MRGRRRTWWGRVKLSLICSSSQSQSVGELHRVRRGIRRDEGHGATCLVVDGLGVASSLQRGPDGGRARSEGCTGGDAEGVHDGWWTN